MGVEPVEVTASLGLPRANYVPEPQPVACDYEIGAYYFPGWASRARWQPVERLTPDVIEDVVDNLMALGVFESVFSQFESSEVSDPVWPKEGVG